MVCVTLNDPDDWEDHQALLDYGFEAFPSTRLCAQGTTLGKVSVVGSLCPVMPLVAQDEVWYPLEQGEEPELQLDVLSPLMAPIPRGAQVGVARWVLHGEEVAQAPVLASMEVKDDRWQPSALVRWWMGLWGKSWENSVPGMGLI